MKPYVLNKIKVKLIGEKKFSSKMLVLTTLAQQTSDLQKIKAQQSWPPRNHSLLTHLLRWS